MANTTTNKIDVASILAPVISSRDTVSVIADAVNSADTESVELDFHNVEFISRSAAHELLRLKEDLQRKWFNKKTIAFVNINQEVTEMLRMVAANKAVPRIVPELYIQETDIYSLVKENNHLRK